jgi:hypothetical protein
MKNFFALVIAALSMNTFASIPEGTPINVPYPSHQERFSGTIRSVELKLKSDLIQKAIEVCGTEEKIAAISNVEVKVSFDVILIEKQLFEGMYPLGSVSALVECFNEGV